MRDWRSVSTCLLMAAMTPAQVLPRPSTMTQPLGLPFVFAAGSTARGSTAPDLRRSRWTRSRPVESSALVRGRDVLRVQVALPVSQVGDALSLVELVLALAKRIRDNYLAFTIAATEFAETVSPQIFGREIPQVLLIHSNDLNADCLDEMLARFAARGYRFVTLDEAMADPAYQTPDTWVGNKGPTWLWRWMKSKGMTLSFAADPEPDKWVVDLYNQR